MVLVLSRSEQMEHITSTTTNNELAISTASASTTKPNAPVYPPDTPEVASARGAVLWRQHWQNKRQITFDLVDDSNKDRKPRKRRIIISDDSDSE